MKLAAEKEAKLGSVLLFSFGHILEFGTISRDEIRQFVDYILLFWI